MCQGYGGMGNEVRSADDRQAKQGMRRASPDNADGQKKGIKDVDRKASMAFLLNVEKTASAETGLHVLHALLRQEHGGHACVQITHSFGLEVISYPIPFPLPLPQAPSHLFTFNTSPTLLNRPVCTSW